MTIQINAYQSIIKIIVYIKTKYFLMIIAINIEDLSTDKENMFSNLCKERNNGIFLRATGMTLVVQRPQDRYNSEIRTIQTH